MRRSSPRKLRIAIVLLAGLGLAAVAGAGSAAEGTAARGEIIELIRLEVRPGQEAAMERFLARLAEGARRTGAAIRWRVHRRVDGERPLYVIVLRATSTEQLEAWGISPRARRWSRRSEPTRRGACSRCASTRSSASRASASSRYPRSASTADGAGSRPPWALRSGAVGLPTGSVAPCQPSTGGPGCHALPLP